jgi:hypothetical protein
VPGFEFETGQMNQLQAAILDKQQWIINVHKYSSEEKNPAPAHLTIFRFVTNLCIIGAIQIYMLRDLLPHSENL